MFACFPQLMIFRSNKPSIMATSLLVNVKVHAPLPHDLENTGANSSFDNWLWIHCLTLPVEKLNALQLSSRPYKWICIAMGVTTGAKGHLTSSLDIPEVVDYNAAHLQPEHPNLYYQLVRRRGHGSSQSTLGFCTNTSLLVCLPLGGQHSIAMLWGGTKGNVS